MIDIGVLCALNLLAGILIGIIGTYFKTKKHIARLTCPKCGATMKDGGKQ